jgi:hypothetical protein
MSKNNTARQVYSPFTTSAANIKAAGGAIASDAAEHLLNVGCGAACSRLVAANVYVAQVSMWQLGEEDLQDQAGGPRIDVTGDAHPLPGGQSTTLPYSSWTASLLPYKH